MAEVRDTSEQSEQGKLLLLQNEIQQTRRHFQAAFEQAAVGMARVSPDGHFLQVNQKLCDILGYAATELQVHTFQDITYPDDLEADLAYVRRLLAGEIETYTLEKRYRRANGSLVWANLTVSLVRGETGTPHYFISVVEDIDERKRLEEALERERQSLRTMMENASDVIVRFDRDLRHQYVNPVIRQITGLDPQAMLGKTNEELHMPVELLTAWNTALKQILRTGQPGRIEFSFPTLQGERFYEARLTPERDAQNEIASILSIARDVTELKQAQEALIRSEARARRLVDSNIIGVAIIDEECVTEANAAFLNLIGATRAEADAGQIDLRAITPTHYRQLDEYCFQELRERGVCTPFEKEYVHKDGSTVFILMGAATLQLEPLQWVCFILDITERKELERRKDTFLSMAGHELRTPVTVVKATVQLAERQLKKLLQQETLSPEVSAIVSESIGRLNRALSQIAVQNRLINDLQDISSINTGKLTLSLVPSDLVALITDVVTDQRAVTPERSIQLDVQVQEPLIVMADPARVGQVLSNYLTNALKYSAPETPVRVGLARQGDKACVWVQDHGPGLTQQQQQRIWERFYQVPDIQVQSGSSSGLGLGLYVCQMVISRHGGNVGVKSSLGQGSTFWFTLPFT